VFVCWFDGIFSWSIFFLQPNARNCDGKTIRVKEDDDDTLVRLCAPQQTMFDKNLNTINNLNTNINIDNF